jgi:hypothetical protein
MLPCALLQPDTCHAVPATPPCCAFITQGCAEALDCLLPCSLSLACVRRGPQPPCSPSLPPRRLSKARTAPEGLPDDLVAAALHAFAGSRSQHAASVGTGGTAAATLPSQPPLPQPERPPSELLPQRSTPSGSGASRPPMPVTPAFGARSQTRSREQLQQQPAPVSQRQAVSSFRQLFDAQVGPGWYCTGRSLWRAGIATLLLGHPPSELPWPNLLPTQMLLSMLPFPCFGPPHPPGPPCRRPPRRPRLRWRGSRMQSAG